jgi:hypothetical protein
MEDKLKLEERATNYQTMRHIERVRNLLNIMVREILRRGEQHDQSKLEAPEVELFTEFTPKLADSVYDSPEYNEFRRKLAPALGHHYAANRHHPEHFEHGVDDMNLIDVVEMFCDWKAAGERHVSGSLLRSIERNKERFGMSDQLTRILMNTISVLQDEGNGRKEA